MYVEELGTIVQYCKVNHQPVALTLCAVILRGPGRETW